MLTGETETCSADTTFQMCVTQGRMPMLGGSHHRTRRRVGIAMLALVVILLILPAGALAKDAMIKDDFKQDDGKDPKDSLWEAFGDGGDIQSEALVLSGTGGVRLNEDLVFHTQEFTVRVDARPASMNGTPIEVKLESETEKGKVKAFLEVAYEEGEGWKVVYQLNGAETPFVSHQEDLLVDVWYVVEATVDKGEFEVNVTFKANSTQVFHHEGELDPFEHENLVELAVSTSEVSYDRLRVYDNMYHWQEHKNTSVTVVLFALFFVVLLGPFLIKAIEHQLEAFLFTCGVIAVTANTFLLDVGEAAGGGDAHSLPPVWGKALMLAAAEDPLMITAAVLIAGLVFHFGRDHFKRYMEIAIAKLNIKVFVFIIVVSLGLVASIITAIISALLLVEIITILRLDRKTETDLTVLSCFSIGLGAALTPVGEPLSTIVIITKLEEEFLFLFYEIGHFIIPSIIALGIIAVFYMGRSHVSRDTLSEDVVEEKLQEVFVRGGKVYLFVAALVLLGTGFAPIIEWYIIKLPGEALYWVNMSSAILDNATLAAAEITKGMTELQLKAALMALLISGGMLIPGNIPNIISANKLHISSSEWAKFGVPLGLAMLAVFFVILFLLKL